LGTEKTPRCGGPYRATLSSILPRGDGPAVVWATDAGVGAQQVSRWRRLGGGGAKPIQRPTDWRSIRRCKLPGSGSRALLISFKGRWPQPALQLGWPQQHSCVQCGRRLAGTLPCSPDSTLCLPSFVVGVHFCMLDCSCNFIVEIYLLYNFVSA
jgi:hypothetical protein